MNEPRSFQKRLAALRPNAGPVTLTPLPDGTYAVDFDASHEEGKALEVAASRHTAARSGI